MGEIRISATHLEVPREPVRASFANFGLDKLMPVLHAASTGQTACPLPSIPALQLLILTCLSIPKYQVAGDKCHQQPAREGIWQQAATLRSAATNYRRWYYRLPAKSFRLKDAPVKTAAVTENDQYYYGNLGQDLMRQFQRNGDQLSRYSGC